MAATEQDIRALEHLAYRLREDTHGCREWDRQGIHQVFQRELLGMNLQIATELVIAHSLDPEAKTPRAITRPFTPERKAPAGRDQMPPRDRDYCDVHPDSPPRPHCPACATEPAVAWYDPAGIPADVPKPGTPEYRALALNAKETAK